VVWGAVVCFAPPPTKEKRLTRFLRRHNTLAPFLILVVSPD
jgi:hypothetical protein